MLLYMKRNPIKYNVVVYLHVYVWLNVLSWFFIFLHTMLSSKEKYEMMLSLMSANQLTIYRRDDFFYGKFIFISFSVFFMILWTHTVFFFGERNVPNWAQGDIAKAAFRIITIKSFHFYGHKARARWRHKAYKLKPKQFGCVSRRKLVYEVKYNL